MVVPVELNRPAIGYTDREWEQILAGMIRAIPVRLASWTNRNHTDPGINLLSQVAAVAESLHYNLESTARELYWGEAVDPASLQRLADRWGYVVTLAAAASVDLLFTIPAPLGVNLLIPSGTRVTTSAAVGSSTSPVVFTTTEDVTILAGFTTGTVAASQGEPRTEILGTSDGSPHLTLPIVERLFVRDSLVISVDEGLGFVAWSDEVSFLDSSGTSTHHRTIRDPFGIYSVRFGDNTSGKIPNANAPITASYRRGGGSVGNVSAGTITVVLDFPLLAPNLAVTNLLAATGGQDAPGVEEVRRTGVQSLRTNLRAVTDKDFEDTAELIPAVARAHYSEDAGACCVVRVCVVPQGGGVPADALLDTVEDTFNGTVSTDPLKMAGVTVVACAPSYAGVSLQGVLHVSDEVQASDVLANGEAAARAWFDETSSTIAFGQAIRQSDIWRMLDSVPGVTYVSLAELTRVPTPELLIWQANGPAFGGFAVGEDSVDEVLTVTWLSSTTFVVSGSVSGTHAVGTIGVPYTTTNSELALTLAAGAVPPEVGDQATIRTSEKVGDILVDADEFPFLETLALTTEGGAPLARSC